MKKFISLLVVLSLTLGLSMTALAEEDNGGIPELENVEKHEIIYELPAPSSDDSDEGVQPLIWGQETHEPMVPTRYTTPFVIPDRYFAYEMSATSGNPNGTYAVALMDKYMDVVTSRSTIANGSTLKNDWIDVDAGETFQFRITNLTNSTLKVTITYYSWK